MTKENYAQYKVALQNAEIFACSYADVFGNAKKYSVLNKLLETLEQQLTTEEYEDLKQTIAIKIGANPR